MSRVYEETKILLGLIYEPTVTLISTCQAVRFLFLFLVCILYIFYILLQLCYGLLLVPPSTSKTSVVYPPQLLEGNGNLHSFFANFQNICSTSKWKTSHLLSTHITKKVQHVLWSSSVTHSSLLSYPARFYTRTPDFSSYLRTNLPPNWNLWPITCPDPGFGRKKKAEWQLLQLHTL